MYRLEMKRLAKSRGVISATIIAFILSVILGFAVIMLTIVYNVLPPTSNDSMSTALTGYDAIEYLRSQRELIAGDYTSDKIAELERHFKAGLLSNSAPEDDAIVEPASELFNKIDRVVDTEQVQRSDYFEARKEYISQSKEWQGPTVGETILAIDSSATEPFRYEFGIGDSNAEAYICICQFIIALISAGIASSAFSQGYSTGADDIMRCAKYGRGKFARAKMLGALSYSVGLYLLCCGVFSVIVFSAFGFDDSAAQFKGAFNYDYSTVLGGITSNGYYALCALAGLLSTIALTAFALWISAMTKSKVAAFAISCAMVMLPIFCISVFDSTRWGVWPENLLPSSSISILTGMWMQLCSGSFLTIGSLAIWTPFAMLAAPVIEAPVFALLAKRAYVRHECA